MKKFDYPMSLEHIASYRATLAEPEVIGPLAEGLRVNYHVTGGEVFGPRFSGRLRPVGADWFMLRSDGVAVLDVRTTLETDDGALIYAEYAGLAEFGPEGYQNFLDGVPSPPEGIDLRIQPVYRTSHPDYLWLNRACCIGVGKAFPARAEVSYDIYQVV